MPRLRRFVTLLRGIAGDDYLVSIGSDYIAVTDYNAVLTLFRLPFRERRAVRPPSRLELAVLSSA